MTAPVRPRRTPVRRRRTILFAGVVLALGLLTSVAARSQVVVTRVDPDDRAAEAGIEAGDVILAASAAGVDWPIATPLRFAATAADSGWRGPVTLVVERDGQSRRVLLPIGTWGIDVRPPLGTEALARLDSMLRDVSPDSIASLVDWRDAILRDGSPGTAAWLSAELGNALLSAGRVDEAIGYFYEPLGAASVELDVVERAALLRWLGKYDRQAALNSYRRRDALVAAVALLRSQPPDHYLARLLIDLSKAEGISGNWLTAKNAANEALAIAEAIAPESLVTAAAYSNLAAITLALGGDDDVVEMLDRAVTLYRQVGANASLYAAVIVNRGVVARERGNLAAAQTHYEAALEILRVHPRGPQVESAALNNLATIMKDRGRLLEARDLLAQALAINEAVDPVSLPIFRNAFNLATIDIHLGAFDTAAARYETLVQRYGEYAPDSVELGQVYQAQARLASLRGLPARASAYFDQARTHFARVAPGSDLEAELLVNHANFLRKQGRFDEGLVALARAASIIERAAPDSIEVAGLRQIEGHFALDAGDFDAADRAYADALRIRQRDAPESARLAETWYAIALLAQARDDPAAEYAALANAVSVLERQRGRLPGDDELQRRFSDRYRHIYEAQLRSELAAGDAAAGLAVAERYRARSLHALLASRDIHAIADAGMREERRALIDEWTALKQARSAATESSTSRAERLRNIELQRAVLNDRIRASALHAADFVPPTAAQVGAALDERSVAIAYFATQDALVIFCITPDGELDLRQVDIGADALHEQVRRFRHLLSRGQYDATPDPALLEQAAALYALLIAPVAATVRSADALVIVPDQSLFALPFPALVAGTAPQPHYLIESHSVTTVQSLALLAGESSPRQQAVPGLELLAIAGPGGEPGFSTGSDTLRAAPAGLLPGARAEAAYLLRLYGEDRARSLVGTDATEQSILAAVGKKRLLHFATHAEPDHRQPLESFLAVAHGDGDGAASDGKLEAWEVFEFMDLDADLVTLSACETAAGALVPSEGLQSLARAFQLAGARQVTAALWKIPDRVTASFMARFYQALHRGEAPAGALREAQLAMLSGPVDVPPNPDDRWQDRLLETLGFGPRIDVRHPYHWATFQLIGAAPR